ncbi:hypothetical protein ACIA5D_30825 [Actinoplanes sp. NPDC051513]
MRARTTGTKRMHHPVVGPLELTFEVLAISLWPGP